MSMQLSSQQSTRPGYRPLYQQVRDLLLERIANGAWRPADALPSEQALADELGVSQGTVRKALDSLAADSLVERRQGKGTYVSMHTQESANFRFFKLAYDNSQIRALPECRNASISRRKPNPDECKRLGLDTKIDVFAITRTRYVDDEPTLFDSIVISSELLPELDAHQPLPNTLYTFYQSEYGVSIVGASEEIKSVAADKMIARALGVDVGGPLLLVERLAYGLNHAPIEFRRSFYNTTATHYAIELR